MNNLVTPDSMKTNFQKVIEKLLEKHKLLDKFNEESENGFYVKFLNEPYMPLSISRHGDMITVTHYYEQNGDLMSDPDVELHYPSWYPTSITQPPPFGYRSKFFTKDGKTYVDSNFHKHVSSFLVMWAKNLRAQKWIENSKIADEGDN